MSNIVRWNPFDDIANFWPRDFFDRGFFGRLRPGGDPEVQWSPRCDVSEKDGAIVVHAELPGVATKDVEVTVSGSQLTVRGEKRSEEKKEEGGRTYSERFFGSFERTIAIPEGVDQSKIEAKLKDGVLEVRVPLPAAAKPEAKKVEVKVA